MKIIIHYLWPWVRKNLFTRKFLPWLLFSELIFWSPCIITAILAIVYNPWFWTPFGIYLTFWVSPITPAIVLQIGLALLLKKFFGRRRRKRRK